jgi:phage gpG-like protein
MPVRGDIHDLAQLRQRLAALDSQSFRDQVSRRMGAEALKLVQDGFRAQANPYGQPWKPLKHRKGRILQDSGRMASSFFFAVIPQGFRLSDGASYWVFHQLGTKHLAQRMMVPMPARGLGPKWTLGFSRIARNIIRDHMGAQ